jgi:hypothetical protein
MNKFEQLIEYVINDEEDKARELFHEIVVEKSRNIYEELMAEEDLDEAKHEEDDEEEVTEAAEDDEEMTEGMMGGDQSDDLIDEIESEEEGVSMEADDEMDMEIDDEEGLADEGDLEDRVVDLEDKLDELMAEFEALMGGESDMDDMGDMGGDDMAADMDMDMDAEEMDDEEMEIAEAISLKAAPKPTTSEEGGINKKSVVAANSGQKGMASSPVKTGQDGGGKHDSAAYKNAVKDQIGKVGNTPAQSTQKLTPAPKPTLSQASGVNNKSTL